MAKKILITNDDGFSADGLIRLASAATEFGDVWVVAPDGQRSAASHSITLHSHIDVIPSEFPVKGILGYKCSGTPADCVRVGILNIMPEKPDIVLSGINNGYNVASDIQYSATVGAMIFRDTYDIVKKLPGNVIRLIVNGHYNETAEEGTDMKAVIDNFISVGWVRNVG